MEIKSLKKALRILNTLSDGQNKPVTLSELSLLTGTTKSTCAHILSTLVSEGYAERVSHTKGYVLGPAAYCLSRYGKYDDEFISLCRPVMRRLYRKSECAVILAVIQGSKKFIIDYIDTDKRVFQGNGEIRPDDIYRTATGRIILANMTEEQVKEIYGKYGPPAQGEWEQVNSYESLCYELSRLEKNSIVTTKSVREYDGAIMSGYAEALFKNGECVGALGLADCSDANEDAAATAEREKKIKKLLVSGCSEICRRLSYS